jgi:hypothetical protein
LGLIKNEIIERAFNPLLAASVYLLLIVSQSPKKVIIKEANKNAA